jgi:hypothetical protein
MEHNPWKRDSRSAGQEILRLLLIPNGQYRVHNSYHYCYPSSTFRSSIRSVYLTFWIQNTVPVFNLPCALHAPPMLIFVITLTITILLSFHHSLSSSRVRYEISQLFIKTNLLLCCSTYCIMFCIFGLNTLLLGTINFQEL